MSILYGWQYLSALPRISRQKSNSRPIAILIVSHSIVAMNSSLPIAKLPKYLSSIINYNLFLMRKSLRNYRQNQQNNIQR